MSAGQVESFFVKHVIDGFLDTGCLGEIGRQFHIVDLVEHFFGLHDGTERPPTRAETSEGNERNLDSKTLRGRRGYARENCAKVLDFVEPFEKSILLLGGQFVKEGIGT